MTDASPAPAFRQPEPARGEVDALPGATVLEFGTGWCGHCRRAQPLIGVARAAAPAVRHWRIEDGPGRPLGRSYGVKLWPTLVFLFDGKEVQRLVRPGEAAVVRDAWQSLAARG